MKPAIADSEGRVTLGTENAGRQFVVLPTDCGGFRLEPVPKNIPEDERWLWENPEALSMVLQGIEESKQVKGVYLGTFEEFADVDLDE